jgi:hypothetical protein
MKNAALEAAKLAGGTSSSKCGIVVADELNKSSREGSKKPMDCRRLRETYVLTTTI